MRCGSARFFGRLTEPVLAPTSCVGCGGHPLVLVTPLTMNRNAAVHVPAVLQAMTMHGLDLLLSAPSHQDAVDGVNSEAENRAKWHTSPELQRLSSICPYPKVRNDQKDGRCRALTVPQGAPC